MYGARAGAESEIFLKIVDVPHAFIYTSYMRLFMSIIQDTATLIGAAAVVYGAYRLNSEAGVVVAGVFLLVFGVAKYDRRV